MTDTPTDQPVADQPEDVSETATPEAADAQGGGSDLDAYLKQFEAEAQPESAPSTPEPTPTTDQPTTRQDLDGVINYVKETQQREQIQRVEKAVAESAKVFKNESGATLSDDDIEAILYRAGDKNPAFAKAFGARDQNPQMWKGALQALAKDWARKNGGQPAPDVDSSKAAVRDALRTNVQSAAPESSEEYGKRVVEMTDAEFNEHLDKDLGYKGGAGTIGG